MAEWKDSLLTEPGADFIENFRKMVIGEHPEPKPLVVIAENYVAAKNYVEIDLNRSIRDPWVFVITHHTDIHRHLVGRALPPWTEWEVLDPYGMINRDLIRDTFEQINDCKQIH